MWRKKETQYQNCKVYRTHTQRYWQLFDFNSRFGREWDLREEQIKNSYIIEKSMDHYYYELT